MLKRIRLENFKSWEVLDLELGNITILFGTNSSGKTSALDALLLLKQTATSFDRSLPMNLGGGDQDYVDFGSFRDLVFQHSAKKRVGIKLDWEPIFLRRMGLPIQQLPYEIHKLQLEKGGVSEPEVPRRVRVRPTLITYEVFWKELRSRVVVERLNYKAVSIPKSDLYFRLRHHQERNYRFDVPRLPIDTELEQALLEANGRDLPKTVRLESCYSVSRFAFHRYPTAFDPTLFGREFEALIEQFAYLGPLRDNPHRLYFWRGTAPREIGLKGEKTIDVLLTSERDSEKEDLIREVSSWLKRMGLVEEFRIEPISTNKRFYETRVRVSKGQVETSLADVGFGVSQVLPVITLLFFVPEGSIVLMEQPEIHLHPCAQAQLADLFLYVAHARRLQLIIESHSEYLLRRLQRRIAEANQPFANPERIRMYFSQIKDGKSVAEPVKVDHYGQISNWPENFFGDVVGDLDAMTDAALERRRQELKNNG